MANCVICGKPVLIGKVVHTACMEAHAKEELKENICDHITRLKDRLVELSMKNGTPRKYAVVLYEAMEVIKQRESERDKLLTMIRGDCRYCTHRKNPLEGPCKGCVHFAAKEFIEGDYWECKEVQRNETTDNE